jgi:hypothetical protein
VLDRPGDDDDDLAALAGRLLGAAAALEGALEGRGMGYMRSDRLGFLATSPFNLGCAMRLTARLRLPGFKLTAKTKEQLEAQGLQAGGMAWHGMRASETLVITCQCTAHGQACWLGVPLGRHGRHWCYRTLMHALVADGRCVAGVP